MNKDELLVEKLKIDIESKTIDIQLKKERLKQMQLKSNATTILPTLESKRDYSKIFAVISGPIILGLLLLIFFFKGCTNKKQSNPIEKVKQIETRLKPIYQKTVYHEKEASNGKIILSGLNTRFDVINSKFDEFKRQKDTVYILAYCDSIRTDYMKYKQTSQSVINHLDSANINYKYIIQSKDTIIEIQSTEIAKLQKKNDRIKLQRNLSFILNGVLGGLLIIK
jgi:hypothetical protein